MKTHTSESRKKITLNTRKQRDLRETENLRSTARSLIEEIRKDLDLYRQKKGAGNADTGKRVATKGEHSDIDDNFSIRQRSDMSSCVLGNSVNGSRENLDL
jgi:hypothetical protein